MKVSIWSKKEKKFFASFVMFFLAGLTAISIILALKTIEQLDRIEAFIAAVK